MYPYRIVFSDLDGTLLDRKGQVSEATATKIRALSAEGIPFVPVSARMPDAICPIMKRIGLVAPLVCYSGAWILGENRQSLHSVCLAPHTVSSVLDTISRRFPGACASVYAGNRWLVYDASEPRVRLESEITGIVPEAGALFDRLPPEGAHKVLCIAPVGEGGYAASTLSALYPDLSIHLSGVTYLEIMAGEAGKSNAIAFLCAERGLSLADAVAFGDNFNDVGMLRAAGLGIAMQNAPEAVKRCAGHITRSNDEEGVLVALNELFC